MNQRLGLFLQLRLSTPINQHYGANSHNPAYGDIHYDNAFDGVFLLKYVGFDRKKMEQTNAC